MTKSLKLRSRETRPRGGRRSLTLGASVAAFAAVSLTSGAPAQYYAPPAQAAAQMPPQCLTFVDAIEASQSFDPRIDASQADEQIARANEVNALARNFPQLSVFGQTGPGDNPLLPEIEAEDTRIQYGLQFQQELYSFGARGLAQKAAQARRDAAKFGLRETQNSVAQGVALAFLDYQRALAVKELAQQAYDAFERDAATATSRLERRIITLTDASQIRARAAVARSDLVRAEVAVQTGLSRLAVLTDMPVTCIDPASAAAYIGRYASNLLTMPEDRAVDEAIARSAAVREAQASTDGARATLGEAKRANLPQLSFYAIQLEDNRLRGLGATEDEFEDETRAGLNLNQQLFAGGRNKARRMDARARVRRAQADEDLQRLIVEDLVKRSLAEAKAQQQAGLALLDASEQARLQLENTQKEYDRGTKTLTDLVLAYEAYFNAAQQETNARFEFYSSLVRVYAATGLLTEDLVR